MSSVLYLNCYHLDFC